MKKLKYKRIILHLTLVFIYLACGSETKNDTTQQELERENSSLNNQNNRDSSKRLSLSQKLDKILSQTNNDMLFNGIEIKEVSRPQKFVGSWNMWADLRGDESTINADGTFKDKMTYFETGKIEEVEGTWYHVTLNENNTSFLLFAYKSSGYSFVSYRWESSDNLYFYYYFSGGHLASRKSSSLGSSGNILERFIYGDWVLTGFSETTFWRFKKNHQLLIQSYSKETDELLVNKIGKWRFTSHDSKVADLSLSLEDDNFSSTTYWSRPNSHDSQELLSPNFTFPLKFNSPETIAFPNYAWFASNYIVGNRMLRSSEPIASLENYFEGTFQTKPELKARNAMTLLISKKSQTTYSVDILWNEREFKNLEASVKGGILYIPTSEGTLQFKPVINGILQISNLGGAYDVHARLLKTSNKPTKIANSLVGTWMQHGKYDYSKTHLFIYSEDGRYIQVNKPTRSPIGRAGEYRVEDEKIYYNPICGEANYDTFSLNQSHLSTNYHDITFLKSVNSRALTKLVMAQIDNREERQKQSYKLIPFSGKKDTFLFAKEMFYEIEDETQSDGLYLTARLVFKRNGELTAYIYEDYSSSFSNVSHVPSLAIEYKGKYYIKIKNGKEYIVIKSVGYVSIGSSESSINKTLPLYDGRRTICYDDKEIPLSR